MARILTLLIILLLPLISFSQQDQIARFLSDSSMIHSSVTLSIINADSGNFIAQVNPEKSLTQASILKLITTAVSLEMLGKDYTFKTVAGYSGKIRKFSKTLAGDIIIKGKGDPSLGSENFPDHNKDFLDKWVQDFKALGIKRVTGRIIVDDSYYDYEPVPSGWGWDDMGNYYGAGVYGLSIYDNTFYLHFRTGGEGSTPVITSINPNIPLLELKNFLTASGSTDNGYVYLAPFSNKGWISGTIPVNSEDFILKASIPDPPRFLAEAFHKKLIASGIKIKGNPVTSRLIPGFKADSISVVSEVSSPPLSSIIEVLNHRSVNLYAEHLLKELGKKFKNTGSTTAGVEVVRAFLDSAGINTGGMFIEDGSGLSKGDAVNSFEMVKLLLFMKKNGRNFEDYYMSLPEAGKDGTLKNYFRDPVFELRFRAKSGSMARVRSYAGYFTTLTGKEMIFCVIINNYTGPSRKLISGIEEIIKEVILTK